MDFRIRTKNDGVARVEKVANHENIFAVHFDNGATYEVEKYKSGWRIIGKVTKSDPVPEVDFDIIEIGHLIESKLSKI